MFRASLIAIGAMLVVSACGSDPPPAPSTGSVAPSATIAEATATPSPTPTPSPSADTAAAFKSAMSDPGFSASSTIKGEVEISADSASKAAVSGVGTYAITGTEDISEPDSHLTMLVKAPGAQPLEDIVAGGRTYTRTGNGPWFVVTPASTATSSQDLASFLRALGSIQDVGVETKDGQQLHHLTLGAGGSLPPAVLGFTGSAIRNPQVSVEFWAKDDGTPGVMEVKGTWQQVAGSSLADVAMTVDFIFSGVGQSVTVNPPATVWTLYTSKRYHLIVGHPSDWDVYPSPSAKLSDEFDSANGTVFLASRYGSRGVKLNALAHYDATTGLKTIYSHYRLEGVTTTTMGGSSAREIRFHGTFKGHKVYGIVVLTLKGSNFYEFDLLDAAGHEAADRTLAAQGISTFAFH